MSLADVLNNFVYHRMEDLGPRERYRNKMQLCLRDNSALLEREDHHPVTLHVEWVDKGTLCIDWSPVNKSWGRNQLRGGSVARAAGLIEEHNKFWKQHASLPAEGVTSASGGRRS